VILSYIFSFYCKIKTFLFGGSKIVCIFAASNIRNVKLQGVGTLKISTIFLQVRPKE